MGIFEQALSGSRLERKQLVLSSTPMSGSTTGFNTSYIVLGVSAESPCRVRLYSDSASMVDDRTRLSSSFNFSSTIGLVLDTELDASTLNFKFDPPVIGTTFSGSETWYHISSSAAQSITFTSYPIEFPTSTGRSEIKISGSNIVTGSFLQGNIYSPRSFIILSGSSTQPIRLRLYSRDIATVPTNEKVRSFSTEPNTGSSLIADISFDTALTKNKFVPILEAYNLTTYNSGSNFVGYLLNNISTSTISDVTASLYIYSTED